MYQYTLQADNVQDLFTWGPAILSQMPAPPGLQDVSSDQQNGGLDELLTYDRLTAAKLGLTVQSLNSALYSAFGQSEVSIIYTQLNQYYVVLEVAPQYWQSPEGLKDIYLHTATTSNGTNNIPLLAVATSHANTTPLAINHTGLFPSVTVSFNLATNKSLSDATLAIDQMQKRMGAQVRCKVFFAGTLLAYQQSLGTEPMLIVTALLAVYIVLGILYGKPGASAHYHFYAAVGQRGRDAGVDAFWRGPEHHLHHWHRAAHWNRQKERHYDDRLRA